MNIQTFPEIKTDRLILRKIEESDCDVILFLRSDKIINKFIDRPENRKTKNLSDAIEHIKKINSDTENNKAIAWGITLNNKPQIIGTICLWNFSKDYKTAEVGYDLNPAFQRKGIMSEALKSVVDFGFSKLFLKRIEAFTHIENESSKKLLEKNGFQLVENKIDSDNLSNVVFEIIKASTQLKHTVNQGLQVNSLDKTGRTAFMVALSLNPIDIEKFLLEKGADVFLRSASCLTSLHYTAMKNHYDMSRLLLKTMQSPMSLCLLQVLMGTE